MPGKETKPWIGLVAPEFPVVTSHEVDHTGQKWGRETWVTGEKLGIQGTTQR